MSKPKKTHSPSSVGSTKSLCGSPSTPVCEDQKVTCVSCRRRLTHKASFAAYIASQVEKYGPPRYTFPGGEVLAKDLPLTHHDDECRSGEGKVLLDMEWPAGRRVLSRQPRSLAEARWLEEEVSRDALAGLDTSKPRPFRQGVAPQTRCREHGIVPTRAEAGDL